MMLAMDSAQIMIPGNRRPIALLLYSSSVANDETGYHSLMASDREILGAFQHWPASELPQSNFGTHRPVQEAALKTSFANPS